MAKSFGGGRALRVARLIAWFGICLGLVCADASAVNLADASGSHMAEPWWRERFLEKQVELHRHPVHLVFLGDSIFHSFEWDAKAAVWNYWYSGRGAVDLGFNSDGTANVIWRVQHGELDGLSPRLAVILIGTNDFGQPPAEIAREIEDLAQTVRDRSADTTILILGILPSGRPKAEQDIGKEVNQRLSALYSPRGGLASYQDVSCVFFHHGRLNLELFREPEEPGHPYPLHPTPRGMSLLAAAIEPKVTVALGDHTRATPKDLDETDCPAAR